LSARRVAYISGTRADFGLMARTLRLICGRTALELGVVVTGMHLSPKYGNTVREIETAGLPIRARVPTQIDEASGAAMARAIGDAIGGMVSAFESWRPDVVLLLGDRGEMLAGAIAAIHLNIPVAHVHGGERSGTVDEPVRHAISKLSHYHFAATAGARERLIRMGERPEHVFITGAPGLDGIETLATASRETLCREAGLDPGRPVCLLVFHPVLQEAGSAALQAHAVVEGTLTAGAQVLALAPNADAGGDLIRNALRAYAGHANVRLVTHMPRDRFVSWMAQADAMVGNSSSGIIEAPSLGLWVVNVGSRQRLREHSENVVDVEANRDQVSWALADVLARPRGPWHNVYGDGHAGERIVDLLAGLALEPSVLAKTNAS
jgi:GDP/UDP-N,N'-diacetylbacillosamine 2-epimerase (hydrolysing)